MMVNSNAIAEIINSQWTKVNASCNTYQRRMLNAIRSCRTSKLGGEIYMCDRCKKHHIKYNSCRNRNCPQCQNTQKAKWIADREDQILETKYYHVVFTLPDKLNECCLSNQRIMYASLFRAAWETLNGFGWNRKYLGGQLGTTMVLHTWGSNLSYHPHVHCIVPGGGVTLSNKWKSVNGKGKYLFPVKELSKVYRAKYLSAIKKSGINLSAPLYKELYKKSWVVYAKPAFGNAEVLIKYLARYAYKTAITHHRITRYNKDRVSFSYTDYRHRNQNKMLTISTWEFVRRFSLHILPKGFCRIRHYGLLNAAWKQILFQHTSRLKAKKDWKELWKEKGLVVDRCPSCKKGKMEYVAKLNPNKGPPRI